ncbi:YdiU family protein [Pacificimonas aurantium]|uniref:YdiU family protein n=1 Tax=Pacificimonas aurantium TaxID=1250540 RepID=A0ABS7WH97_9SPHN|nr:MULTISPECIES: YdiU family protein [Pacificimonas]MBZ6377335.1 YdiU family protein [Pacificimonas aurantium]
MLIARPRPTTAIETLGPAFYDRVAPARFPKHLLRFRNDRAAKEIGLETLSDAEWLERFAGFEPFSGSLASPLALRYHGHQFRTYNPDIGDGRGFLFAQFRDETGRLLDLGTKGSGQTPFSRFGDGRLTLKGGVRELLATEMLEALGVETSRTLSLVETGEALDRNDEPSPTRSAVMVRLSHSHIRYGSFQRLAYLDDGENIHRLTAYCLEHFVGDPEAADPFAALMDYAVAGAARLAASYRVAGFVHGVLNTDNINITAESFDYGPWRFAPRWDEEFTAAYFDQWGLYSFGRQAEALQWNVHQLALALRTQCEADSLIPALKTYADRYEAALAKGMVWRLGLNAKSAEENAALVQQWEQSLATADVEPDRAFFDWRGGRLRRDDPQYESEAFRRFAETAKGFETAAGALDHPYWSDERPCSMLIDEVEAIWAAIDQKDDWTPLYEKVEAARRMGAAHAPLD